MTKPPFKRIAIKPGRCGVLPGQGLVLAAVSPDGRLFLLGAHNTAVEAGDAESIYRQLHDFFGHADRHELRDMICEALAEQSPRCRAVKPERRCGGLTTEN